MPLTLNVSFTSDDPLNSAVVDDATGGLLSAVSVTDVGRVVVPAQNNQILGAPLKALIAKIKVGAVRGRGFMGRADWACLQEPDGSTDGADKFPGAYSVDRVHAHT